MRKQTLGSLLYRLGPFAAAALLFVLAGAPSALAGTGPNEVKNPGFETGTFSDWAGGGSFGAYGAPGVRVGSGAAVLPLSLAMGAWLLEQTKGFRGEANSSYRRAKEAVMKADAYAYRDRRNRKRDFRRLWITRINAAARQNGMSYGTFMHGLKLAGIEIDRKVLADIAVRDADTFRRFAEAAREASTA